MQLIFIFYLFDTKVFTTGSSLKIQTDILKLEVIKKPHLSINK